MYMDNVKLFMDGKEIKVAEVSLSSLELSDAEYDNDFNFKKSYEGTLTVDYIDEIFLGSLSLHEYQKALLRKELRQQQLKSAKKNKLNMRESMNKHFKRGKKW